MTARPSPHGSPTDARGLSVVDLFCGAGGLSEGFRSAGYDVIGGADYDPDAIATYSLNFPKAAALNGDVRDPDLRDEMHVLAQRADVIIGGPPCQGFSQVRNHSRLIEDPRNALYKEFVDTVAEVRPRGFVMENVPGMAQIGVLQQVLSDLSIGGDYLVQASLLDAADFGVPQTRKRLIFVGLRRGLGSPPPSITGTGVVSAVQLLRRAGADTSSVRYEVTARDSVLGSPFITRLNDPDDLFAVTVEQAIGDLRSLEMGRREDVVTYSNLPEPSSAYQRLMRAQSNGEVRNVSVPRAQRDTLLRLAAIPAGGNHRDLTEELSARYITGDKWGPNNGTGRLGRAHFYAYRRLHPAVWAWTLNTKGDSAYHYSSNRALSVREFARLQSFGDHFQFAVDPRKGDIVGRMSGGATHSKYRQVGNAVPPLLARAVAERLAESLISERSVPELRSA